MNEILINSNKEELIKKFEKILTNRFTKPMKFASGVKIKKYMKNCNQV